MFYFFICIWHFWDWLYNKRMYLVQGNFYRYSQISLVFLTSENSALALDSFDFIPLALYLPTHHFGTASDTLVLRYLFHLAIVSIWNDSNFVIRLRRSDILSSFWCLYLGYTDDSSVMKFYFWTLRLPILQEEKKPLNTQFQRNSRDYSNWTSLEWVRSYWVHFTASHKIVGISFFAWSDMYGVQYT